MIPVFTDHGDYCLKTPKDLYDLLGDVEYEWREPDYVQLFELLNNKPYIVLTSTEEDRKQAYLPPFRDSGSLFLLIMNITEQVSVFDSCHANDMIIAVNIQRQYRYHNKVTNANFMDDGRSYQFRYRVTSEYDGRLRSLTRHFYIDVMLETL